LNPGVERGSPAERLPRARGASYVVDGRRR
jgi:hypothetical protein